MQYRQNGTQPHLHRKSSAPRAARPQSGAAAFGPRPYIAAPHARRRKRRGRSLRLLIFSAMCLCLAAFGIAATRPPLPTAVSSIVYPLDLGGAWDADTETALHALAARRPEVQPMLDDPAAWPADVAALLARNEEALDFVLAYPSLAGAAAPDTVEEEQKGIFPALLGRRALRGQHPCAERLRPNDAFHRRLRADGPLRVDARRHCRMGAEPGLRHRERHQLEAAALRLRAFRHQGRGAFAFRSRRPVRAGGRQPRYLQRAARRFYHRRAFYYPHRHTGRPDPSCGSQQPRAHRSAVGMGSPCAAN